MKVHENNQLFTEVSAQEASSVNGGYYSRYINSIVIRSGAWRYFPYARRAIGNGQRRAYRRGGTTGQLNYLLGLANRLSRF